MALTTGEVIDRLERAGVPVGPVRALAEVLADPGVRRRQMVLPLPGVGERRTAVVNTPFKVDGRAPTVRRPPPRLGEHTAELLGGADDGR